MPFATAHTVSLHGALGHLIDVQADVSPGTVGTTLIGRPDASLNEARDRCRMAVTNSGLEWPNTRRVTVLLAPADLAKSGTHYDLPIAVSVLAAVDRIPRDALTDTAFVGELTLSGGLRSVPGVLPMVLAAAERGITRAFVPEPHAREAAMVPGMTVFGMRSLGQVVAELRGEEVPEASPVVPMSGSRLLAWRGQQRLDELDFGDLFGMADAKFSVEVAAAGGHPVLLTGPKGAGKTSLAERVPTILPELTPEESLELTAIHSLAGALEPGDGMLAAPPYSAPHHDASKASLIGGGSGQVRPGEISRAHGGVLFLDEFPLFRSDVIEALRQPLESGEITVARREESVTLPARCLVVLACNPCPCGEYSPSVTTNQCTCNRQRLREYQARITGPIADRIDISRQVAPLTRGPDPLDIPERSAQIRDRVARIRQRQHDRFRHESWRLNGHAPGVALRDSWPLTPSAQRILQDKVYSGVLSSRGAVRVHRVAWTLADLRSVRTGTDVTPGVDELDTAVRLRTGEPLLLASLERRAG
jgi:magnesium chelatase family protein